MSSNSRGSKNIELLMIASEKMGDLVDDVVFLGGCIAGLLVEAVASQSARATEDVDVIIDVVGIGEYHQFSKKLKAQGFNEATGEDALICRWQTMVGGTRLLLDVMPTDKTVLGFSNPWYDLAARDYDRQSLPNDIAIKVIRPLIFLATKFAAWHDRGKNDIYHKDVEDIIYVLENRPRIAMELLDEQDRELCEYLKEQLTNLVHHPKFMNHLSGMVSSQGGDDRVLSALKIMTR